MTNLRHSVFVKLLILFIVITLPILIIGITAIALSSKKLEKEIYQSVQASTNSFAAALDEEMEALSNSAYSIYSATKLDWYSLSDSLMSPYDREDVYKRQRPSSPVPNNSGKWCPRNNQTHSPATEVPYMALYCEMSLRQTLPENIG